MWHDPGAICPPKNTTPYFNYRFCTKCFLTLYHLQPRLYTQMHQHRNMTLFTHEQGLTCPTILNTSQVQYTPVLPLRCSLPQVFTPTICTAIHHASCIPSTCTALAMRRRAKPHRHCCTVNTQEEKNYSDVCDNTPLPPHPLHQAKTVPSLQKSTFPPSLRTANHLHQPARR